MHYILTNLSLARFKKEKIFKFSILFIAGSFLIFPPAAQAVMPPDFIFNIGTQVVQIFSIAILFFTAIFSAFFQFFKARFYAIKHKKIVLIFSALLLISISLTASYFFAIYKQKIEYQKWLEESSKNNGMTNIGKQNDQETTTSENIISNESNFFANNENKNIIVTNQEFKNITDSETSDYIVLDARENIEYENGYFPGSLHIRFADLEAGQWTELPKEKYIYVICWSGIRGKEVAEFLRTKKIIASYLENGANGWVEFGGKWIGSIKFSEKYELPKYQIVFTTAEIKNMLKEGVFLVDAREPDKFAKKHIAGSVNIPIMHTSSADMEKAFSQVPANSKVVTVCDEYVNCFDAKITGVELELRGHQFLGRYNKPWEYE